MFALNAVILYGCFLLMRMKKPKTCSNNQSVTTIISKEKTLSKTLLICGLILAFAVFAINMLVTELGKEVNSAILFSVSYAISIIITLLVGSLYYKEKVTLKNVLGIILCVGSLAIINFL